jgi:small subunit ribosomal protein S3Ae
LCSADAFARKEWYDVRTPSFFNTRNAGKTPINRTQGTST